MTGPNFNCRATCLLTDRHRFGREVWRPVTRLFDDRRRRRMVRVGIRMWPCGTHYYVDMRQDDNPAWSGDAWCVWPDDPDGRGARITEKFGTMRAAKDFVRRTMEKRFPGHRLWKDSAAAWRPLPVGWLYKYEGD